MNEQPAADSAEPGATAWDHEVDLVIVGSGGGGMVAALTAADAGASALVLEKRELIGGSTAMSGGVVWIPNHPLLADRGPAQREGSTPRGSSGDTSVGTSDDIDRAGGEAQSGGSEDPGQATPSLVDDVAAAAEGGARNEPR